MRQALRAARRALLRHPAFSVTTMLVFALALAGLSAISSIVRSTLFAPLPFAAPDQLVQIEIVKGGERGKVSVRELEDVRERSNTLAALGAFVPGAEYSISGQAGPEKPPAILMTSNLFEVLGIKLLYGTTWPSAFDRERQFGLVLSHRVWQRQFGGDPTIVGRMIPVDASPFFTPAYTIHGVLPPGIDFPGATDLYRSFFINPAFPSLEDRAARNAVGIARLREGVSPSQAQAELSAIADRLRAEFPATNDGVTLLVRPLREAYVGDLRPYLVVLMVGVGLLLAAAVANVANLFVSFALNKEHEIAVKRALGGPRHVIVRDFALEGALLAGAGGVLGCALGWTLLRALSAAVRLDLPTWMIPRFDVPVVVLTMAVAILCGVTAGTFAGLSFSGSGSSALLRAGERGRVGGRREKVIHTTLVGMELAFAVMLLLGTTLMVRTFVALTRTDVGFRTERLLTFRLPLPWTYPVEQRLVFFDEALRQIRALPGVVDAGYSSNMALAQVAQAETKTVVAEGQSVTDAAANPLVNIQRISERYIPAMAIPLLQGRGLTESDDVRGQLVALVNRALAGRLWPNQSALGRRLLAPDGKQWLMVVGVVGDVRHERASAEPGYDVYVSVRQFTSNWNHVAVRTSVEPMSLVEPIQKIVWSLDPTQAVYDFKTMQQRVLDTEWIRRVVAIILGAGAVVTLQLAGIGVYGVVTYFVSRRTREIGVRMALGASPENVLRDVLRRGWQMAAPGVACGLAGTLLGVRLLSNLLYGVHAYDVWSFVGVPLMLMLIVTVASWIPARRATHINPSEALQAQ